MSDDRLDEQTEKLFAIYEDHCWTAPSMAPQSRAALRNRIRQLVACAAPQPHIQRLAAEKGAFPERFCPESECLWRIRGEVGALINRETNEPARCPIHTQSEPR